MFTLLMTPVSPKTLQVEQVLYPISTECRTDQYHANVSHCSYGILLHRGGFSVQTEKVKYETSTHIIGSFAVKNFITIFTTNGHESFFRFQQIKLPGSQKSYVKSVKI
jgi:hypothetical protein